MLNELKIGAVESKIPKITTKDVVNILEKETNDELLQKKVSFIKNNKNKIIYK